MQKKIVLFAVTLAVIATALVTAPSSDAVDGQDSTIYCYGDHPMLVPHWGYNSETVWTFESDNGNEVEYQTDESTGVVTIDISNHDKVYVTQEVNGETAKATLIGLHLMQDENDDDKVYTITFHDRGNVIHTHEIKPETVVTEGDLFVITPEDPTRDGYEFGGWYTDSSFVANSAFDPRDVVTSDMDVYAKWIPVNTPSGGDSGHISSGTHTVTFQCDEGLTYNVVSNSNGTVSFTVSELTGYDVIWSTVKVDADSYNVTYSNGVYTISGIHSDVIVSISGECATSSNPNDSEGEGGSDLTMYAIILVIVAIICIALAVYIMRTRGSRV